MTPHRAGDKKGLRGSFIIDRRTRVGRIAVASGTNHVPTFKRLNEMVTTLNETGRTDLLRSLRDGEMSPLFVYEAFRVNELHRLPTSAELKPVAFAMWAWYESVDCSLAQKAAHKTAVVRLAGGTIAELPAALQRYRERCRKAKTPAQFNRVRASALAFIRDTLKRSHRLYGEVRDVPLMKEKKAPERHILSWSDVQAIAPKLEDARDRAALYGMVLTGMGPKEWYIDGWKLSDSRITIHGEKRASRARIVPAVRTLRYASPQPQSDVGRERERRRFGERLLSVAGIRPYDLRRTYANWLESAGISRTRRIAYLGHSGGDVTSIYERHEVDQFLAEDASRIEAFLAQPPITLHITKQGRGQG